MNCLQCNSNSRFIRKFYNLNDPKKIESSLYKCLECNLYFFDRKHHKSNIYKEHKLSTSIKKPRHELLSKIIKKICKKGNILEIGAGDGHILNTINDNSYQFSVIDYHKSPNLPQQTIFYNNGIDDCPINLFDKNQFDIIIMDNLIEHLRDPQETIKKVSEWLSRDGYICVSVPNRWNLKNLLKLDFNCEFSYPSEHLNIYTRRSINYLFNSNGYQLIKQYIFPYNFFSFFNMLSLLGYPIFGIYCFYKKREIL